MCISDSSDHILTYISVQPVLQLCSKSTVLQIIQPAEEAAAPAPTGGAVQRSSTGLCAAPSRLVRLRLLSPGLGHTHTFYTVSADIF